jgi:tRNA(fMet)-specific endonuclease VapC
LRFLLDTNVWVDYLNRRYSSVVERIQTAGPDDLALSSVVLAELRYGADKSQHPAQNHARLDVLVGEVPLLAFDADAAAVFGRLRSHLESQGSPIGPYDMQIAAQALSRQLVLVTDNVREFGRIQNLRVENWRAPGP